MHRAHWNLEDAFAFDHPELMPLPGKGRQHRAQSKIFSQRMHRRPVIMQRARARVGMAFELESEQVLDFPLLPVERRERIRQGDEPRLGWRHRDAQDEKAMRRVQRKHIIQVEIPGLGADIIRKQAGQPRPPFLVKQRAKAGHQLHFALEINFVGARDLHGLDLRAKALGQTCQDGLQFRECVHGAPPIMSVACRMTSSSGAGSHTLNTSNAPSSRSIAGAPARGAGTLLRATFGSPGKMRANW